MSLATGEWVLSIDAERVTLDLALAIGEGTADGYEIRRRTRLLGPEMLQSRFFPDCVLRLFRRGRARFSDVLVHESVTCDGPVDRIAAPLLHDPVNRLQDALSRIDRYSTASAEMLVRKGRRVDMDVLSHLCLAAGFPMKHASSSRFSAARRLPRHLPRAQQANRPLIGLSQWKIGRDRGAVPAAFRQGLACHAYYLRARKVHTLIKRDFEACFAQGVNVVLAPTTPSAAFAIGEKGGGDPVEMYLNDVFTVTVNMACLAGLSVPVGLDAQCLPLGLCDKGW
jgi:hypothetical protein